VERASASLIEAAPRVLEDVAVVDRDDVRVAWLSATVWKQLMEGAGVEAVKALVAAGAPARLSLYLAAYSSRPDVLLGVLEPLRRLVVQADAKRAAAGVGAVETLLAMLDRHCHEDARLAHEALAVLKSLAVDDDVEVRIVAADGHMRVLSVLRAHPTDSKVAWAAAGALRNLFAAAPHKPKLAAAGVLEVLISTVAAFAHEPEVLEECCGAIRNGCNAAENKVRHPRFRSGGGGTGRFDCCLTPHRMPGPAGARHTTWPKRHGFAA